MNTFPVLCTITQAAGRGGIARVSSLLWQVLQDGCGPACKILQLAPAGTDRAGMADRARFACRVAWEQLAGRVDWILFDHFGLARVQRFVPAAFRRPYAVFLHSVEAWRPLSPARLQVLRNAVVRLANSHYTVARIAQANPDVGPIEVCHLSLPPPSISRESCAEAADVAVAGRIGPNSVLIVGRILSAERHKGHDRLIRAWPQVLGSVPDAQLVIVGEGDDLPRLRRDVRSAGLERSVFFTGHVSESTLNAIYSKAAVYAMPSSGEGFGLVFLEAMAHGLACIGSLSDASREIIEHGETGLLVDPEDSRAIAWSITALLSDARLRERLGRAGRGRVQAQFSFERFRERVSDALRPLNCHAAHQPQARDLC